MLNTSLLLALLLLLLLSPRARIWDPSAFPAPPRWQRRGKQQAKAMGSQTHGLFVFQPGEPERRTL